ncbi:hypothetical protein pdam_00006520 [Pocillopora damicornis]|uniref:Uncharacterized protein n=1 Tax=Pocillopora damicornis TaxID=46731 RepID=A0A3M6THI9_POCDA|nr:hypothetical protein pdam_00006520 [Pocillopora damicornis]
MKISIGTAGYNLYNQDEFIFNYQVITEVFFGTLTCLTPKKKNTYITHTISQGEISRERREPSTSEVAHIGAELALFKGGHL